MGKKLHIQQHLPTACRWVPECWNRPFWWNRDGRDESKALPSWWCKSEEEQNCTLWREFPLGFSSLTKEPTWKKTKQVSTKAQQQQKTTTGFYVKMLIIRFPTDNTLTLFFLLSFMIEVSFLRVFLLCLIHIKCVINRWLIIFSMHT